MPSALLAQNLLRTATLSASSTLAGSNVANLADDRLRTAHSANAAGTQTVLIDCGSAKTADSMALLHTNLATAGATVKLESSTDNITFTPTMTFDQLLVDTTRNLLPDPSFLLDAGASTYFDLSGPCAYSATGGYANDGACILATGGGATVIEDARYLMAHKCVVGDKLPAAGRVWLSSDFASTGQITGGVAWYDAGGALLSNSLANANKTLLNQWQILTISPVAPASAAYYRWRFSVGTGMTAGSVKFDSGFLGKPGDGASIASDGVVSRLCKLDAGEFFKFPAVTARYWRETSITASVAPVIGTMLLGTRLDLPNPLRPALPTVEVSQATARDSSKETYCYNRGAYDGITHQLAWRRLTSAVRAAFETLHRRDAVGQRSFVAYLDHLNVCHPVKFSSSSLAYPEDGLDRYRVDATLLEESAAL